MRCIACLLPLLVALCTSCGTCGSPSGSATGIGEAIPDDEQTAIKETTEIIQRRVKTSFHSAGLPARRDAHPKAHGCVKAKVTVPELQEDLRVGVFREPRTYFAWIRYSNALEMQSDSKEDGRGMAIKLMGVPGSKILDAEADAQTQDFLMVNYPMFFVDTAANYAKLQKDPTTIARSLYFLRHWEQGKIFEATSKQKVVNPLETQYYSMAAYLFGDKAVKFSAKPCEVHAGVYKNTPAESFLADNMEKNLKDGAGCFELMVQFQTNPTDMPVEDPTKRWEEEASPFRKVAQIEIPSQSFRSPEQIKRCEDLSFNPWHALPEHRPLGGINRMRRVVYETISSVRHDLNGVRPEEPTAGPDFLPSTPPIE